LLIYAAVDAQPTACAFLVAAKVLCTRLAESVAERLRCLALPSAKQRNRSGGTTRQHSLRYPSS
jgi:hypothetical protein